MKKKILILLFFTVIFSAGCTEKNMDNITAEPCETSETELTPTTENYIQTISTTAPIIATSTATTLPQTTTSISTQTTTALNPPETFTTTATEEPTESPKILEIPTVSAISVDCLKVTWNAEPDKNYTVSCQPADPEYAYEGNIHLIYKEENNLCYINGLRENNEYYITVTPEGETDILFETVVGKTETVEVIEEFPYEEGWTNCFTFEKASGLTAMPSSGAIAGSISDPITETGIRRDEYGDYCCAMGLFYGECWDRFLIELENGIQFTVKICDSKGWADDADEDGINDGRFHWFGGGKSIIEFIHDGYSPPIDVAFSGNYGYYNWNGLDLSANIYSIQKINYGNTIEY